ncbi:spore germination protein GerPE [Virgibacillus ndiopensis]|uniref:spore germination protein GerPE n=1 Tax=Virgibacillus ndiopensis TaxID=2004408 RepID=UPI000C07BF9A|nr:spore germination protein GerPE [Virgibacillus ndiopensis]
MEKRNVNVNYIKVNSASFSSILSIGDTAYAGPKSRGIAVQKEGAIFTKKDEVQFKNYDLFSRKATWPKKAKHVRQHIHHHEPNINMEYASFIGIGSSSICQVGSIDKICAEARLKHFRILRNNESHTKK